MPYSGLCDHGRPPGGTTHTQACALEHAPLLCSKDAARHDIAEDEIEVMEWFPDIPQSQDDLKAWYQQTSCNDVLEWSAVRTDVSLPLFGAVNQSPASCLEGDASVGDAKVAFPQSIWICWKAARVGMKAMCRMIVLLLAHCLASTTRKRKRMARTVVNHVHRMMDTVIPLQSIRSLPTGTAFLSLLT